jgi:ADP-ribosyl-[dinitrogen reductase] hydrolase
MNHDKAYGCMVGLAVGDAIGTTVEFKERDTYPHLTGMVGGGPFRLNVGEWTDDTSMMLALGQALADHGMDQIQILKNFAQWYQDGNFSHNGRCFDIGITTRQAIGQFISSDEQNPVCGATDHLSSGNGGIMRLAPAAIFATSEEEAMDFSEKQSVTTHASPDCVEYAREMGYLLWHLLNDHDVTIETKHQNRDDVKSSGYVVHTYDAACWAVANTDNFRDAVLLAVNLGDDADTVGAVTGQIAGAKYGLSSIPDEWVGQLAWIGHILKLTDRLLENHVAK